MLLLDAMAPEVAGGVPVASLVMPVPGTTGVAAPGALAADIDPAGATAPGTFGSMLLLISDEAATDDDAEAAAAVFFDFTLCLAVVCVVAEVVLCAWVRAGTAAAPVVRRTAAAMGRSVRMIGVLQLNVRAVETAIGAVPSEFAWGAKPRAPA